MEFQVQESRAIVFFFFFGSFVFLFFLVLLFFWLFCFFGFFCSFVFCGSFGFVALNQWKDFARKARQARTPRDILTHKTRWQSEIPRHRTLAHQSFSFSGWWKGFRSCEYDLLIKFRKSGYIFMSVYRCIEGFIWTYAGMRLHMPVCDILYRYDLLTKFRKCWHFTVLAKGRYENTKGHNIDIHLYIYTRMCY